MSKVTSTEGITILIYRTVLVLAIGGLGTWAVQLANKVTELEIYKATSKMEIEALKSALIDAKVERTDIKKDIKSLEDKVK